METGEELTFLRDGLPRDTLRKLRRGHWAIQDEIDLHGLNRDEARACLCEFLKACIKRKLRCLRIVHGKGLRSPRREPVLKSKMNQWLAQRDEVLAFCQAPESAGGAGALLLLLKG
jgi:DNA-nicking Smr family endonuclease